MKKIVLTFFLFNTLNLMAQAAGALDPTFGNQGKVVTSVSLGVDKANSVVLQADGKIIIAGYSTSTVTGKDFLCIRYNTDGTIDNTFGTNGIVAKDIQLGSEDIANSLDLQSDGKIILAGNTDDGSNKNGAILRLNTNGTIDSTFGVNGIVNINFENQQQDEINVVKINKLLGHIIVGGSTIMSTTKSKPIVARFLNTGVLDTNFNHTGIKFLNVTSLDYQYLFSVEDLIVTSNGKISATGWRDFPSMSWSSDVWVCRINSNGTMDNTFSTDGVNTYNNSANGNDRSYAMLLKSDGTYLTAGGQGIIGNDFKILSLSSNGSLSSLGAPVDFGSSDMAYAIKEDGNGKLILAGKTGGGTSSQFAIARFNPNGTPDNMFGTSGMVTTTFGNTTNECFDAVIQVDNKIIAVGYTGNDIALARYTGLSLPQLSAFQLIDPPNNAIDLDTSDIQFNWEDAFGATSYELQIDDSPNFATAQSMSLTNSFVGLQGFSSNTTYYWRVRATDGINWGNYTTAWKFNTKARVVVAISENTPSFSIYPNPSTDLFNIKMFNYNDYKVVVKNMLGQVVQTTINPTSLDLSQAPKGIYLVEVEQNNTKTIQKISVQ